MTLRAGPLPSEAPDPMPTGPEDPARFLNRELSQLAFNERVLALAEDSELPPLERAKFLAITAANLDEFFQVRVAALQDRRDQRTGERSPDGRTASEELACVRERVLEQTRRQYDLFQKELVPALAEGGLRLAHYAELGDGDREQLARLFQERLFPVLTPLAVDPVHPFPYISNLSLNLAVSLRDPGNGERRFARLKVPGLLPRFLLLPDGERFIAVEELIAAHLETLFPGMEIVSHHAFRVTRDADLDVDGEQAPNLLQAIESGIMRRRRLNDAVRLEVGHDMPAEALDLLRRELEVDPDDVYVVSGPLALDGLWALYELDRPSLKLAHWSPLPPPGLAELAEADPAEAIFEVLVRGDVLLHHPYESFESSVAAFLSQAARDPHVLAIKTTVYRTSGPENPVVRALIRAAHDGKEVVALVELKARFDEEANIEWAQALEQAGVHVLYGIVGLKTHAKAALVVRQEPGGIRRYCHIGSGNYNPATARVYEDIGLLSASEELGADLTQLFNYLTGFARPQGYRRLWVAPTSLRSSLLQEVQREGEAPDGHIVLKVNHLSDPEIIDALYAASQRGTKIELIVRGICALRPRVPGLSDSVRVRSILGPFLEHSRIFRFGSLSSSPRYYIGSADLVTRKLDRRVEAVVSVLGEAERARLEEILAIDLADDVVCWELASDGRWHRRPERGGISSQERLRALARERASARARPPELTIDPD
jgi:polyphosphate kinase